MLAQIGLFVLQTLTDLLAFLFLLRFYVFLTQVNLHLTHTALSNALHGLTDWAVLPLRRVLPRVKRIDFSSLLPALLLKAAMVTVVPLFMGRFDMDIIRIAVDAVFQILLLAISGMIGLIIVYALLSLFQPHSQIYVLSAKLCEPLLTPFRKFIPLIGGVDLSSLAAIMSLQILSMVVKSLHFSLA